VYLVVGVDVVIVLVYFVDVSEDCFGFGFDVVGEGFDVLAVFEWVGDVGDVCFVYEYLLGV